MRAEHRLRADESDDSVPDCVQQAQHSLSAREDVQQGTVVAPITTNRDEKIYIALL